jgi:hypothetical protein
MATGVDVLLLLLLLLLRQWVEISSHAAGTGAWRGTWGTAGGGGGGIGVLHVQ